MTDNQSLRLQVKLDRSYLAIYHEDREVGFCTPEFADLIVEALNENDQLHEENETINKALQMACLELLKRSGGKPNQVMRKYLQKAKRPKHGSRAIAHLLRDRQKQLDLSNHEFIRFCDSYKLSPQELLDIYKGKEVTDSQLRAVSRIVGKSFDELVSTRDGFSNNQMNKLARILGTSSQELAELFE